MATDNRNNDTNALGPDGRDDITGDWIGFPEKQEAITLTDPVTGIGPGLLMDDPNGQISPEILQLISAQSAQLGLNQQKASSQPNEFQVDIGLPHSQSDSSKTMGGFSPFNTVHYGFDTAVSAGFMAVNDPRLVQLVTTAANGKIEFFDEVYKSALTQAAYYQKMGKNITVADVLRDPEKYKLAQYNPNNSPKYTGPVTTRRRDVSLTSASQAHRILNAALQGYLGREATTAETEKFLRALNVQERANPTVTTTVQDMNDKGSFQTISSTSNGQFDQADFTERFAKSQEGYAEYQAATTYLDAFIGALENKSRVI